MKLGSRALAARVQEANLEKQHPPNPRAAHHTNADNANRANNANNAHAEERAREQRMTDWVDLVERQGITPDREYLYHAYLRSQLRPEQQATLKDFADRAAISFTFYQSSFLDIDSAGAAVIANLHPWQRKRLEVICEEARQIWIDWQAIKESFCHVDADGDIIHEVAIELYDTAYWNFCKHTRAQKAIVIEGDRRQFEAQARKVCEARKRRLWILDLARSLVLSEWKKKMLSRLIRIIVSKGSVVLDEYPDFLYQKYNSNSVRFDELEPAYQILAVQYAAAFLPPGSPNEREFRETVERLIKLSLGAIHELLRGQASLQTVLDLLSELRGRVSTFQYIRDAVNRSRRQQAARRS